MSLFDLLENPSDETPSPTIAEQNVSPIEISTQRVPIQFHHTEKLDAGYVSKAYTQSSITSNEIFSIEEVDIELGTSEISAVETSNNILYLALSGPQRILRIFLDASKDIQAVDFDIPKKNLGEFEIQNIFLDPYAQHCIIAANGFTFYLSADSYRAKLLNKLKGYNVTCVAWNKDATNSPMSTDLILVSTKEGIVYELILENTAPDPKGFFSRKVQTDPLKYIRPVFVINEPIMFLFFEPFPVSPSDTPKYVVFLISETKFYQFVGLLAPGNTPSFERVFSCEPKAPWLIELYNEFKNNTVSLTVPVYRQGQLGIPKQIAWLTSQGLYCSSIVMGSQSSGDSVLDQSKLFTLGALEKIKTPLGFVSLPFHRIIFDHQGIYAYFSLPDKKDTQEEATSLNLVWSQTLQEPLVSFSYDTIKHTLWAVTRKHLLELVIRNEDRNIWKYYLERHQFESAMTYAKTKENAGIVLKTQADYYFASKRYILSAQFYSKTTSVPFEHVTLKFIEKNEMEALRVYLGLVLKNKVQNSKDSIQAAMIAIWLFELNLDHLNDPQLKPEESIVLEQEIHQFIKMYHTQLEKNTVHQLCMSYNRPQVLLTYYHISGDAYNILNFHCDRNESDMVLNILEKQGEVDHFYTFIPFLIKHAPKKTVQLLIKRGTSFEPSKFLPSFLKAKSPTVQHHLIEYLEFCVVSLSNRETSVHNFLLLLYAKYHDEETKLCDFLSTLPRYYDLEYALRICHQFNRISSCIYLFDVLEMPSESAELSLKQDNVEHAMQVAKSTASKDIAKNIWISIMQHLIKKKEFKRALGLLKNNQSLHLNEILRMFPDFCEIDDFKDELINVLEEYVSRLRLLESEMDANDKSADAQLRLSELPNKVCFVPNQACPFCDDPLYKNVVIESSTENNLTPLSRQNGLVAFPCQHVLHRDCCTQGLQSCPICGDTLIQSIDSPFLNSEGLIWDII